LASNIGIAKNISTLKEFLAFQYPLIITPPQNTLPIEISTRSREKIGSLKVKFTSVPNHLRANEVQVKNETEEKKEGCDEACYCKKPFIGKFDVSHSHSRLKFGLELVKEVYELNTELLLSIYHSHPPGSVILTVQLAPPPKVSNQKKLTKRSLTASNIIQHHSSPKKVAKEESNKDNTMGSTEWYQLEFIKIVQDDQQLLLVVQKDISNLKATENELKLNISRSTSTSEFLANLSHGLCIMILLNATHLIYYFVHNFMYIFIMLKLHAIIYLYKNNNQCIINA
jgi:hypothetical protein